MINEDDQDSSQSQLWGSVLGALKTELSEGSFNTYLKGTHLQSREVVGTKLIYQVGCGSNFIKNTIDTRFLGQITRELSRITNKHCEAVIKVGNRPEKEAGPSGPLFEQNNREGNSTVIKKANLRADFVFDNFAVAGSNQMAYAAAMAVAQNPGPTYNPLFIYGGVGVGKTHLMQAAGNELVKRGESAVLFCSGEEFTNDLVDAIRYKTTDRVRAKYRKVKLLMIDDVQFIAGKVSVQEEFFHTFNAIVGGGGQIIMTSDRPPAEIVKLEARLKSRFGAGLIVDIAEPDFELKTAILLIKAKQRGFELSMEAAQAIAANTEGVRESQGFLIRVETVEKVKNRKLEVAEIKGMLSADQTDKTSRRLVTPAEIIGVVGNYYGVGVSQLKGDRRTRTIAWPRQVLMYILRTDVKLPLDEVGRLLGGRDHTTVMHAADKVKNEIETNNRFAAEITDIKKRIFETYPQ